MELSLRGMHAYRGSAGGSKHRTPPSSLSAASIGWLNRVRGRVWPTLSHGSIVSMIQRLSLGGVDSGTFDIICHPPVSTL